MSANSVKLIVNGAEISDFKSVEAKSMLFATTDAITLTFDRPPAVPIKSGDRCMLLINEELEMNGILEGISRTRSKTSRTLAWKGRDVLCLLLDHHIKKGYTLSNITLLELAQELITREATPYLSPAWVKYGEGSKLAIKEKNSTDKLAKVQVKPGETIFEVINKHARQLGWLFFATPEGWLYFNTPTTKGQADYQLVYRLDGRENNIIDLEEYNDDISSRYSEITVKGQVPGSSGKDVNVSATVKDSTFPYFKPLVESSHDGTNPKKEAELRMARRKAEGRNISYIVSGFGQGLKNYQPNVLCHVIDEDIPIEEDMLIIERTFKYSKENGARTTLKLMWKEDAIVSPS